MVRRRSHSPQVSSSGSGDIAAPHLPSPPLPAPRPTMTSIPLISDQSCFPVGILYPCGGRGGGATDHRETTAGDVWAMMRKWWGGAVGAAVVLSVGFVFASWLWGDGHQRARPWRYFPCFHPAWRHAWCGVEGVGVNSRKPRGRGLAFYEKRCAGPPQLKSNFRGGGGGGGGRVWDLILGGGFKGKASNLPSVV